MKIQKQTLNQYSTTETLVTKKTSILLTIAKQTQEKNKAHVYQSGYT